MPIREDWAISMVAYGRSLFSAMAGYLFISVIAFWLTDKRLWRDKEKNEQLKD